MGWKSKAPHDYFGEILAENQHGRHVGFFPTPMEVCQLMALMTMGEGDTTPSFNKAQSDLS